MEVDQPPERSLSGQQACAQNCRRLPEVLGLLRTFHSGKPAGQRETRKRSRSRTGSARTSAAIPIDHGPTIPPIAWIAKNAPMTPAVRRGEQRARFEARVPEALLEVGGHPGEHDEENYWFRRHEVVYRDRSSEDVLPVKPIWEALSPNAALSDAFMRYSARTSRPVYVRVPFGLVREITSSAPCGIHHILFFQLARDGGYIRHQT
ncbi:hypothetical protein JWS13_28765 [Rhodococcus pseudokoreensis]|uniref:Uncharacterized protein n=1 Tax=Rhodococcus pseudokoreensis TaxID=2811421 RepID=A0A974W7Y4_9NOCA|nr:hypothetical protein [Rhodococcus pseudokoreensis]QSE92332.1 hypothetical protein JWS13_28765 [Rhodococcus pseudokoreensis]